jgi:hypothetical protein
MVIEKLTLIICNSEEEDITNTYRLKIIFSPGRRIGYILLCINDLSNFYSKFV